jgi:UDP-N-acetylglucosamine/UDP-N-acetylgalactosamine diphosphorylase
VLKTNILKLISALQQPHLSYKLESLNLDQLTNFLCQLKNYPKALLDEQRATLASSPLIPSIEPLNSYEKFGNSAFENAGKRIPAGCLILAGGQGSRLGGNLPKALTPVSVIKNKTLLQLFCEKTKAASLQRNLSLKLAIMTSPSNDVEIREYLHAHHFFGLNPLNVECFSQTTLPFLDDDKNWQLTKPGMLACGPNGNGYCLQQFYQKGIWDRWHASGIEQVTVIPIDNPLADPFNAELLGMQSIKQHEVTLQSVLRLDSSEKTGIICLKNQKIGVQEYTELPANSSAFTLANISIYCLSMPFIKKVSQIDLPWHLARKSTKILDFNNTVNSHKESAIWKFEAFLFDVLDYAHSAGVLLSPRQHTFAPLKNREGAYSLSTVQKALLEYDRYLFEKLTNRKAPSTLIELPQEFHYPTLKHLQAMANLTVEPHSYFKL